MSLCHNRNPDLEETIKNPNIIPDNEIINIKQDSQGDLSYGSLRRTKKNKTRMPKEIVFNDDEILSSQYKRGDSSLEFEHAEKNNIKEKNIINFDDNEEIKENHNEKEEEENNLVENGQEEDVEMKVEIKDGEDIVIPDSEKSEEEMNLTENKDALLRNRNNENGEKKEEPKESNNNEVDIKEDEEKKEESNEGNNNNEVDIKENEEKREKSNEGNNNNEVDIKENEDKKDEEKEKEEEKGKKEEENGQEKEEKGEEKNEEEEKEENEEEKEVNDENSGKKEEPKEDDDIMKDSEIKDLTKYDQLIKIINKNLESKGFSELDIKNKIDEIYKNLSDSTSTDILITKLSDLLIELMDVSLDSDKNEIQNFIKDITILFNGDIIKIHEQLVSYIKGINDQSKLQNRASNRVIRGHIKKCANQLKERLKQEDIPSDKIVSFQKFKEIMNETGVELKEEHLDILLYQMKMKVPKGRSFDTLNMIVVVDFLK